MDTKIDTYISNFNNSIQDRIGQLRKTLKKVFPEAQEGLKWGRPAFSLKRVLVVYAAYKKHIGFYPTPEIIDEFKNELKEYEHAKGSIQFPHEKPLPLKLIEKMARARYNNYIKKDAKWK